MNIKHYTIIKRTTNLSISHSQFLYKSPKMHHGKIIIAVVDCIVEFGETV